jgi:hypothetical protein
MPHHRLVRIRVTALVRRTARFTRAVNHVGGHPFMMSAAVDCGDRVGGGVPRRRQQPRRQHRPAAHARSPPRQHDEHPLRDILRKVRIAPDHPPRRGVHQVNVPLHQPRERSLTALG